MGGALWPWVEHRWDETTLRLWSRWQCWRWLRAALRQLLHHRAVPYYRESRSWFMRGLEHAQVVFALAWYCLGSCRGFHKSGEIDAELRCQINKTRSEQLCRITAVWFLRRRAVRAEGGCLLRRTVEDCTRRSYIDLADINRLQTVNIALWSMFSWQQKTGVIVAVTTTGCVNLSLGECLIACVTSFVPKL